MRKDVLLLLFALLSLAARGQKLNIVDPDRSTGDSIDRVRYEVVYDLAASVPAKADTLRYNERMLLQIGASRSAFFSYAAFQLDSLVQAQLAKGGNVNVSVTANVSWKLYKNYPATGQTTYLDRVCNDNFRVVEKVEVPQWRLVADSVRELLGYRCRLAEASYKGRLWAAWYAEDVPLDNGPWKLQGLPGLILKAYDSGREFVFTAVGLANVHDARPIRYKGARYAEVSRKQLNKIYKRYYSDAIGYAMMTFPQSSTSKITVRDENGNTLSHSKPEPYNLLEW